MTDTSAIRPVINVGDWVKVTPVKGYLPASGPVVRVPGDGIDVMDFAADRGRGAVLNVKWPFVAALERIEAQPVFERKYVGQTQDIARRAYEAEAQALVPAGYRSVTQTYKEGAWSSSTWLVALLLIFFGIGLLVAFYLVLYRPEGTLVVTYARGDAAAAPVTADAGPGEDASAPPPPPGAPRSQLADRLAELASAHGAGLMTDAEFERRRAEIIAGH